MIVELSLRFQVIFLSPFLCMLSFQSCSSAKLVTDLRDVKDEPLVVLTKDSIHYHLSVWTVDSLMNIHGEGLRCDARPVPAKHAVKNPRPFSGVIHRDQVLTTTAIVFDTKERIMYPLLSLGLIAAFFATVAYLFSKYGKLF
jgi:hypothetical protein